MSDGHEHDDDDAADAQHDHGFDGEPAKELGPDEPMTPAWVPALGAALFVAAAVFFLVQRRGPAPAEAPLGAMEAQPQMVATALPGARVPPPGARVPPPAGAGTGTGAMQKMTPAQIQELQKRLQQAGAKPGDRKPPQPPAPAPDSAGH